MRFTESLTQIYNKLQSGCMCVCEKLSIFRVLERFTSCYILQIFWHKLFNATCQTSSLFTDLLKISISIF